MANITIPKGEMLRALEDIYRTVQDLDRYVARAYQGKRGIPQPGSFESIDRLLKRAALQIESLRDDVMANHPHVSGPF
jgi:hypothetical protein